jgi:NAD(P)-dependent dehydrogenase (short-subunit alcohol dehydrogenase family)
MNNSGHARVLLITGGASGIGTSVARMAASRGYHIAINYRSRKDAADTLVEEITALGQKAFCFQANVSDLNAVKKMFEDIHDHLGPVWGLVNSAGISHDKCGFADLDQETIENVMRTNVLGSIYPTQEAIKRMANSRGGAGGTIVNISSMSAATGGRDGAVPYATSKGAIDVMTKGLGRELASDGVRVNAVRPGMTISDMTRHLEDPDHKAAIEATIPMKRIAEADEVAAAILWLLSDEASFVTGAILDVSGGGFTIPNG